MSGNIRRIAPNLLEDNRSGQNLSGVLNQERQQAILNRRQSDHLSVQNHYLVPHMHKQVFITIELSVQGWQKALLHPKVTPFYTLRSHLRPHRVSTLGQGRRRISRHRPEGVKHAPQ